MIPNLLILAAAALVPLVMGFVWYNPKTFGNAWMQAAEMTEDKMKGANMPLIFGLTYVFSFLIAFAMFFVVVHQAGYYSVLVNEPGFGEEGSDVMLMISQFMEQYGDNFRTFKHGALHGGISGVFFIMPIIAINAMFERKGFKYIAIHAGYWIVSMIIMGGIICQWA